MVAFCDQTVIAPHDQNSVALAVLAVRHSGRLTRCPCPGARREARPAPTDEHGDVGDWFIHKDFHKSLEYAGM